MTVQAFFDTNVLVYALSTQSDHKASIAYKLVQQVGISNCNVSTQTLVECVNVLRRLKAPPPVVRAALAHISRMKVHTHSPERIVAAHDLCEQHQIQWFDALLLQAALDARCNTLYSEDFQSGRQFQGKHGLLNVVNPFA